MFSFKGKLRNPNRRLPLRDDFPPVVNLSLWSESVRRQLGPGLSERIGQEIEKSLGSVGAADRITVAYPHKAPGWVFARDNGLRPDVVRVTRELEQAFPAIRFEIADGLCERYQLNRSAARNQSIVKTATKAQPFDYVPKLQDHPISLLALDKREREPFILLDDVFCQGTTAANMISFIEHNGGHVLAAAATKGTSGQSCYKMSASAYLTQYEKRIVDYSQYDRNFERGEALRGTFKNAAYSKGCLPVLAVAFYEAAQKEGVYADLSHEQHLEFVDQLLQARGRSLSTMTTGECYHMADFFGGAFLQEPKYLTYKEMTRSIAPLLVSYRLS